MKTSHILIGLACVVIVAKVAAHRAAKEAATKPLDGEPIKQAGQWWSYAGAWQAK